MRFKLTIDCDNAAFEADCGAEVARVLRVVAKSIESFPIAGVGDGANVRDSNGNTVGEWKCVEVDAKSGTRATTRGA